MNTGSHSENTDEMERKYSILWLENITAEYGTRNLGELTNDPENYVEELQKNSAFQFQETSTFQKQGSFRWEIVFLIPFCSKFKATLTGRYYPKWDIKRKTKSNIHYYGPIAPNTTFKRGSK